MTTIFGLYYSEFLLLVIFFTFLFSYLLEFRYDIINYLTHDGRDPVNWKKNGLMSRIGYLENDIHDEKQYSQQLTTNITELGNKIYTLNESHNLLKEQIDFFCNKISLGTSEYSFYPSCFMKGAGIKPFAEDVNINSNTVEGKTWKKSEISLTPKVSNSIVPKLGSSRFETSSEKVESHSEHEVLAPRSGSEESSEEESEEESDKEEEKDNIKV